MHSPKIARVSSSRFATGPWRGCFSIFSEFSPNAFPPWPLDTALVSALHIHAVVIIGQGDTPRLQRVRGAADESL
jgi:hypothetical protein